MAKDYGNRRSSRSRHSGSQQFLVVIVTFLLGYLTASIADIQTISHWLNTQVIAHHEKKPESIHATRKEPQIPPKPKFEFYTLLANEKVPNTVQSNSGLNNNNGKINTNSTISKQDDRPSKATTLNKPLPPTQQIASSAVSTAKFNKDHLKSIQSQTVKVAAGKPVMPLQKSNKKYVLQVAAFKARQDAEHMKGLLILKGYNVNVVPVSNARGNWFRVVIGPYTDIALAQKAQINIAKSERLKGMISAV